MATAFAHGVAAVALGSVYAASSVSGASMPARFWALSIACSALPDLDVVGLGLGIPYGSVWGHRGITHSLFFAAWLSVAVVILGFPNTARFSQTWWMLAGYFFIVTASHGLLDAMTNGGLGVAFFAPFDTGRYFLPWRPIEVSPIGVAAFFTSRGLEVLKNEFAWIWIPSLAIICALRMLK